MGAAKESAREGNAMPRIIHPLAGLLALLTITTFWLSTTISELFLSRSEEHTSELQSLV